MLPNRVQNAESAVLMKYHVGIAKFEDRDDFDDKTVASHLFITGKDARSRIEENLEWYERQEGKRPSAVYQLMW